MRDAYEIAGLRVEPGTRAHGWLEVARGVQGEPIGIPLIVLHGSRGGKTVLVDAVTHGDEAEGPLGLLTCLRDIDPADLSGTLIAVPALNSPAYAAQTRGNPIEINQYDMNRAFPGDEGGSITARLAHAYFNGVVRRADAVLALHSGGTPFYLSGYIAVQDLGEANLELVKAMGWPYFTDLPDARLTAAPTGTINHACAAVGIPSITVEIGGAGYRSPALLRRSVDEYGRGIRNVLIHYGLLAGEPNRPDSIWSVHKQYQRSTNGGVLELAPEIDVHVEVEAGQLIASVLSLFGEVIEEIRAPFAGFITGLPGSPQTLPGRLVSCVSRLQQEFSTDRSGGRDTVVTG